MVFNHMITSRLGVASLALLAMLAFLLGVYTLGADWFLAPWAQWSAWMVAPLAMTWAAWAERQRTSGAYPWRQALATAFGVYVLLALGYHVFYHLLTTIVDPHLLVRQRELIATTIQEHPEYFNNPNAYEQQELLKRMTAPPTWRGFFWALSQSLILGFLLSSVVAWFCRREIFTLQR